MADRANAARSRRNRKHSTEPSDALLDEHRMIPLVYLPETYGIAPRVHFQAAKLGRVHAASGKPLGGTMSFRTKVFLSITATVVLAVWMVAAVVSTLVTQSFERRDAAAHRIPGRPIPARIRSPRRRRGAPHRCRRQLGCGCSAWPSISAAAAADTAQYYARRRRWRKSSRSISSSWSGRTAPSSVRPSGPRASDTRKTGWRSRWIGKRKAFS